jgi:hypothetical protein
MLQNDPIQQWNSKEAIHIIGKYDVQRTPFEVRLPQLIRYPNLDPQKVRMIATHPTLNYVKMTTFKSNGFVPGM